MNPLIARPTSAALAIAVVSVFALTLSPPASAQRTLRSTTVVSRSETGRTTDPTVPPYAPPANWEPKTSCAAEQAHDSCAILKATDSELSLTYTATVAGPMCTSEITNSCTDQVAINVSEDIGYGPWVALPATKCNKPTAPLPADATTVTCTTTWTWSPLLNTPTNFSVGMSEANGEGVANSNGFHSWSAAYNLPPIAATFSITPVPNEARTFRFFDTSPLPPGLSFYTQEWSYDDNGSTVYGFADQASTSGGWTYTFPADGTYLLHFGITDSAEQAASDEQEVDVVTPSTSPASITVIDSQVPHADAGRFNLAVDGHSVHRSASDGGKGVRSVTAGRHRVSETVNKGSLTDYGVELTCVESVGTTDLNVPGTSALVTVKSGGAQVCTFTNTGTGIEHCDVPNLSGKVPAAARSALAAGHCTVGRIKRARKPKSGKYKLVVASSSPAAYRVVSRRTAVTLTERWRRS